MDAIWRNILEGFWGWKGYEVYPEEQLRAAAEENGERETVAVCTLLVNTANKSFLRDLF